MSDSGGAVAAMPRGYCRATIGEVVEDRVSQEGPTAEFIYLDIGSIDRETKRFVDLKTVAVEAAPSRARQRVRPLDVLVSMTRPNLNAVAMVTAAPGEMVASTGFHVLRSPWVEPKFLFYLVQTDAFIQAMTAVVQGALYPAVRPRDILSFPFDLPPRAEQTRIVEKLEEALSNLDAGVAELKAAQRKLARYRRALLNAAIQGRLTADWRAVRSDPRSAATAVSCESAKQVPDVDRLLPDGWRSIPASAAGDILLGRQRAPQFLTGMDARKYLRVANVKDDRLDFSDLASMDFDAVHFEKYSLKPGDILVSEGQSPELVGQSAIFRGFDEPLCFQKTLHRFRARPEVTSPDFAQIVFRANVANGTYRQLASITTNIAHLTLEKFKSSPFPLPPLQEQEEIVSRFRQFEGGIVEASQAIEKLRRQSAAQRTNVLRAAFAGELVPQIATDEPAGEILARARIERAVKSAGMARHRRKTA